MRGRIRSFTRGAIVGVAAEYLFDPQLGNGRRAKARDMIAGKARRTRDRFERRGRRVVADAQGKVQKAIHSVPQETNPDDRTLVDRVRSEAMRDAGFPKDRVSIEAMNGVIVLRGELRTEADIERVEGLVLDVSGVLAVHSMMHLPGTPAPNKRLARQAS